MRRPTRQRHPTRRHDLLALYPRSSTLFHELGHVLNDPRGQMHLEYNTQKQPNTVAEKTANQFALDILFGDAGMTPFSGLTRDHDIQNTAQRLGIAPGVALHQMHRRRLLDYRSGNRLSVDLAGTFT